MSSESTSGERPKIKQKDYYIRCMRCKNRIQCEKLKNKKEYVQLISLMKNNSINTPSRTQLKLKTLFHEESIFEFVCVNCKAGGNPVDKINKLKNEIEIVTHSSQAYTNEINILRDKNANMETEIQQLKQMLLDKEKELTENQNIDQMEIDEIEENEAGAGEHEPEHDIFKKINKMINIKFNKINEHIAIMNGDIEARIKIEFDKIQAIFKDLNKNNNMESDRERKKTTNTKENTTNTPKTRETNRGKETTDKLKPPVINNRENNREIYEIHLSKFHTSTNETDIETHIMEKTKIKYPHTFKITTLRSKNDEKNEKYITFKVTTLNREVYEQIMNEKIWKPDFEARDFITTPRINEFKTRRYLNRQHNITHTPKRSYTRNPNILRETLINNTQRRYENNKRGMNEINQKYRSPRPSPGRKYGNMKYDNENNFHRYNHIYARNTNSVQNLPLWHGQPQYLVFPQQQPQNFLIPAQLPNQNIQQQRQPQTQPNQVN